MSINKSTFFLLAIFMCYPVLSISVHDADAQLKEAKKILAKVQQFKEYYDKYRTFLSDVRENLIIQVVINKSGIDIDDLDDYFENLVYEKLEEYFEENPILSPDKFNGIFKNAYNDSINLGDEYQYLESDYQSRLGVYQQSKNYREFIDENKVQTQEHADMVLKLFNLMKLTGKYDKQRVEKMVELQPLIKEWSQARDAVDGDWNTPNFRGKLVPALADLKLMKLTLLLEIKKLVELREELLTMEKIFHVDRINRKLDLKKNNAKDVRGLYEEK